MTDHTTHPHTSLVVTPTHNGKRWRLVEPFTFGGATVPAGFETDFASIPRPFWWLLPKWGKYGMPAIIHDYRYTTQTYTLVGGGEVPITRKLSDLGFLWDMKNSGVNVATRHTIYYAVRAFGWLPWWWKPRKTNGK